MNYGYIALNQSSDIFTCIQEHISNGKKIELSYLKHGKMLIKEKNSHHKLVESNQTVVTDCKCFSIYNVYIYIYVKGSLDNEFEEDQKQLKKINYYQQLVAKYRHHRRNASSYVPTGDTEFYGIY